MNNSSQFPDFLNLPSGGEGVGVPVEYLFFKHITRLLSDTLSQVLVVNLDKGNVTSVARNDGRLSFCGDLIGACQRRDVKLDSKAEFTYLSGGVAHIVVARPVEVLVRPLSEGVFTELSCSTVVLERELGVRLEELRLLHWVTSFL